ncbi:MAG TPA: glycosyltransferase family 1 protein [Dissulfurispiraceae bacterium]|nr:glycosyltransferase family 1 protein [Dissulfurispiraceae bacterium]
MKIILGVDAITRPLTGTGRYALELAKRLPLSAEICEAIFFAHGNFVSQGALLNICEGTSVNSSDIRWHIISMLRRRLAQSPLFSNTYNKLIPIIGKVRLRPYSGYLFHGTGFLLPPHDGPSVVTIHDLSVFRRPEWHPRTRVKRQNAVIGRTLGMVSHIITDSETVRQEVIDYFSWPAERITAVPLGVNGRFIRRDHDEVNRVLGDFGLTDGSFTLSVATVEPRKNIERLIMAYEKLPVSLRSRYPLVIAGDNGWKSEDIHDLMDEAKRKGWLKYLGYVPDSCLPALYSGCRAFLYPSLYEGFGLPILEAMACGAPVLTSNCSCMPEVAGDAGILVDPKDVESISAGIEKALTDDQWRLQAAERGIGRSRSMTWDISAHKTVEVYRKVWEERVTGDPSK